MATNKNTLKNIYLLLERCPDFVTTYTLHYHEDYNTIKQNFYRRLVEIEKFLNFYRQNDLEEKNLNELTQTDIEKLPITTIQQYISTSTAKQSSLKFTISVLSSFWSYFTNYSFTVERGKPLFYRHAFDEWKIAYSDTYTNIKNDVKVTSNKYQSYLNKEQLIKLLDYIDNSYILTLDTNKKVENWNKDKERYLAAFAFIIGTGVSLEELVTMTMRDVDMRKKEIKVKRNGETKIITVLDFCIPYISNYMSYRRKLWNDNTRQSALFINQKGETISTNFFTSVILRVGKTYPKPLSVSILKNSHAYVLYEETNNLSLSKEQQGLKTLTAFEKFLI